VLLYNGKGSWPNPGLIFFKAEIRYHVLKYAITGTWIDCSCSVIFLGRELNVFSPLVHADTETSPLGRMCWSHRIDIVSRRSEGIKCDNFVIPIRDKEIRWPKLFHISWIKNFWNNVKIWKTIKIIKNSKQVLQQSVMHCYI
jgi:hypothetical protein